MNTHNSVWVSKNTTHTNNRHKSRDNRQRNKQQYNKQIINKQLASWHHCFTLLREVLDEMINMYDKKYCDIFYGSISYLGKADYVGSFSELVP